MVGILTGDDAVVWSNRFSICDRNDFRKKISFCRKSSKLILLHKWRKTLSKNVSVIFFDNFLSILKSWDSKLLPLHRNLMPQPFIWKNVNSLFSTSLKPSKCSLYTEIAKVVLVLFSLQWLWQFAWDSNVGPQDSEHRRIQWQPPRQTF